MLDTITSADADTIVGIVGAAVCAAWIVVATIRQATR